MAVGCLESPIAEVTGDREFGVARLEEFHSIFIFILEPRTGSIRFGQVALWKLSSDSCRIRQSYFSTTPRNSTGLTRRGGFWVCHRILSRCGSQFGILLFFHLHLGKLLQPTNPDDRPFIHCGLSSTPKPTKLALLPSFSSSAYLPGILYGTCTSSIVCLLKPCRIVLVACESTP